MPLVLNAAQRCARFLWLPSIAFVSFACNVFALQDGRPESCAVDIRQREARHHWGEEPGADLRSV